MKQAVEQCYGKVAMMQNYRLLKGMVFDGSEPNHCVLDMQTTADGVELKVSSLNGAGKPVFHYAANFVLGDAPSLEAKSLSSEQGQDAAQLYSNGTLFHGESLQVIKQLIRCDEQGLQLRCQVDAIAESKKGSVCLEQSNLFANDVIYQAMLVWVREQMGLGSLPSATQQWTFYREAKVGESFSVLLEVVQHNANQCIADVQLIDQQGRLIADAKGVKVTASASLNTLFKP